MVPCLCRPHLCSLQRDQCLHIAFQSIQGEFPALNFLLEDPTQLPGSSKFGLVQQENTSWELGVATAQVAVGISVARAQSSST